MSARIRYSFTLFNHGETIGGTRALAATGGGVWATLATVQYMRPGAACAITDDARTQYTLAVYGIATFGTSWTARLRDTTNGVTILSTQVLTIQDAVGQQFGPLSTWPAGNAVLELQYTGGGTGALYYASHFVVTRT